LEEATQYFDNISLDLIYGIPGMSNEKWKQNIETALRFGIPHISSYALTVEPKTALNKLIQTGKVAKPNDEVAQEHFAVLVELLRRMVLYIMNYRILERKIISRKTIRRIG
jgi:oxygen-independent coproporphyrinogen-3 oxidase